MTTFMPTGHSGVRMVRGTKTKTPSEVLTFGLDFSADPSQLATGETITGADGTPTVSPSGELTVDSVAGSGQELQITLSAGSSGTDYTVSGLATTSGGQKIGFKLVIVCTD